MGKVIRAAVALQLAGLGLAMGCGGHAAGTGSVPGLKHFTPETVNALRPGMSEEEVVALLGRWDHRDDRTPGFRGLEYDALANNPAKGFLMLQVWAKDGQLWQAYLTSPTYDSPASMGQPAVTGYNLLRACACIDNSVRPVTGSEHECEAGWARSCLALIDPPVKTCAAADLQASPPVGGDQIELLFDPVERQPREAEHWASLLESKFYGGWGRVRLAWRADAWQVQSACLKFGEYDSQTRDLARRLPPRDLRQKVADVLQQSRESEPSTSQSHAAPVEPSPGGGGTVRSISAQFSADDLEILRQRLNGSAFHDRLRAFTCGDPPPEMSFALSIVKEADYQERQVFIQPIPNPSPAGRERCLSFGLDYEIDQEVSAVDHGSPLKYHYKDPHTGRELPPDAGRIPVRPPVCDCSRRDSNAEWVTWPAP